MGLTARSATFSYLLDGGPKAVAAVTQQLPTPNWRWTDYAALKTVRSNDNFGLRVIRFFSPSCLLSLSLSIHWLARFQSTGSALVFLFLLLLLALLLLIESALKEPLVPLLPSCHHHHPNSCTDRLRTSWGRNRINARKQAQNSISRFPFPHVRSSSRHWLLHNINLCCKPSTSSTSSCFFRFPSSSSFCQTTPSRGITIDIEKEILCHCRSSLSNSLF